MSSSSSLLNLANGIRSRWTSASASAFQLIHASSRRQHAMASAACFAFAAASKHSSGRHVEFAGSEADELKKKVGYKAVDDHVRSGMVIGLGTGSTAYFAVERIGQKLKSGELENIVAIPTSTRTEQQAVSLDIPLTTLDTHPELDVSIDGADAVDPSLNLVKGGGGCHFREKLVESASKKFIVIVDESKLCNDLGPSFSIPVEILRFSHEYITKKIEALPSLAGCKAKLRLGSVGNNKVDGDYPAVTDNGNYIVDLQFNKPIIDVKAAAKELAETIGVVEHGFFVDMATEVIVAGQDGIFVERKVEPKYVDVQKKSWLSKL